MTDRVECHSGASYAERPIAFHWQDQRLLVSAVTKRWRTPEGLGFRVRASNGQDFELFYRTDEDEWQVHPSRVTLPAFSPSVSSNPPGGATLKKIILAEHVDQLRPSSIRRFFDIADKMKDVISLGIGEPDFSTPEPILQAGIRSLLAGDTHYTSNAGRSELRLALAKHLERLYGVSYDPDTEIIVTVGVSEALYLALNALLNPGDEVIVVTPCFVSYQAEVRLAHGGPVEVGTYEEDLFQLRADRLEAAVTPRTRAILIGYPSNPTGTVATRETLLEVARIAEEHDLIVISDELYDQLVYGVPHVCFAGLPGAQGRTILLGGFSKNYAMTGWRIGYAAGPAEMIKGLLRIHQYTIMSAPTPSQMAAIEALKSGAPYVEAMRVEYDRRRRLIVSGLNNLGLPTVEPHGAFYAFPNIAATGMDEETFAQKLLQEERVAVVPGGSFGPGGEGFVRCSYATAYEKIEEALARMGRFMERYG